MTKIVKPKQSEDENTEILSGVPVPFELWDHQREIVQAALTKRRIIVLKARQLGVTWVMALFALWYAFAHPNSETVIVSIGEREARIVRDPRLEARRRSSTDGRSKAISPGARGLGDRRGRDAARRSAGRRGDDATPRGHHDQSVGAG